MMVSLGYGGAFELIPFPPERKAIDIGDYYSDFSLISRELGWVPKVQLRDGLKKTLDYYHTHGERTKSPNSMPSNLISST